MLEGGGIINPGVMRREGGNGREEGVQQWEEERGGNWMTLFPLSRVRRERETENFPPPPSPKAEA